MCGALTAETLNDKLDVNGTSFKAASTAAGYGGKSHEVYIAHLASINIKRAICSLHIGNVRPVSRSIWSSFAMEYPAS